MRLLHLQLFDYRNFHRLDLPLPAGPALFIGDNAQGKTNLLEAVHLLATMRVLRAETDAQLIRRQSLDDVLPAARLVAQAETLAGPLKLEVAVVARPGAQGPIATKTVRVNGVPRRLSDAVGRFLAVLFSPDDLDLVSGPPSLRRQFLDITLSQVEPAYAAARHRFERVLLQRNHLLKSMRERGARPEELAFWDEQLSNDGGLLFHQRARASQEQDGLAGEAHRS
ncbi:MAG TPA: DNA replication and repair protein RecF, partial [Dehalococcoidia bacterium]|nr:DNA replication and repair protein RecF [Dehalococcoidia bacterium]